MSPHAADTDAAGTDGADTRAAGAEAVSRFRSLLEDGRVHLLDGAMGTELYGRGFFVNVCYDELNLSEPRLVVEVHRSYVEAGSEAIETNTFGANPVKLSGWGLEDRTEEINRQAARLAREAAGDSVAVLGAVGPLGIRIEPYGPTSEEEAREYFRRQIEGLAEGGVDGFVLETFNDPDEVHQALLAAREVAPDLPVVAQMTVNEEGTTSYGTEVEQLTASLTEWGADVIGLNCSVGPASMLEAVERMAAATDVPLSAQPNAGMPRTVGDRKIYLASPEYMAQYARRLIEAGVRFIGGCCGTTPDHVARMGEAVAALQPRIHPARVGSRTARELEGSDPVPLTDRSRLGQMLAEGAWVTSVAITPPRGWNTRGMVERCRRIRDGGVDVAYLVESARGQSRMGVIPAAGVVQDQVGMETLVLYTCRDRNMLGMISDLLGAAAAGLRNVLVVSGDPTVTGPYQDATTVFDIDSIGLVNVLAGLNRGLDPGGSRIDRPTRWAVGVSLNPGAVDRKRELERWRWKVEAGADFAVTQPFFEPDVLTAFLEESDALVEEGSAPRIPLLAEIPVFRTGREAEFLANEVPGVAVPASAVERMRDAEAQGSDAVRAEGIAIARETVEALRPVVDGVQLDAGEDVDAALEALDGLGGPGIR